MGTLAKLFLLVVMAGLVAAIIVWDRMSPSGATTVSSGDGGLGKTGTEIVHTLQNVKDQAGEAIEKLELKRRAEETLENLDLKRRAGEMVDSIGKTIGNVTRNTTENARRQTGREATPHRDEHVAGIGPDAGTIHVVRAGDTLWAISTRHYGSGSHVKRIEEANRETLAGGQVLKAGMKLRIPPADGKASAEQARKTRREPPPLGKAAPAGGPRTYRIQPGDTLWRIAQKELGDGNEWKALYEANRDLLVKPSDLKIGMEIRIPEDGR